MSKVTEQDAGESIKIIIRVRTNKVESEVERTVSFDREEWEEMSEREQSQAMQDYLLDGNLIEWDWQEG